MAGAITTYEETGNSREDAQDNRLIAASSSSGRLGRIVALSLAAGLAAVALFIVLPVVAVRESSITGAALCGVGVGWAVLWLLSGRFTDQPQRWAVAPALFMGVSGLLMLTFGSPMSGALDWVWPPALLALVIWMLHQMRGNLHSRSGRVQLYLVLCVLALSAVGGGYQAVGEATDSSAVPAAGSMIDVGGHQLYLSCVGSGSPTVVLEAAAGATSSQMGWIAPMVAGDTRVCVYDRAGRGRSQQADTAQDGAQIATDLHALLHRAGETGPYVLAGHSFGGLYVRIFAAHYPEEVAGLVLIDSTASKEPARSVIPTSVRGTSVTGRIPVLASLSARVGLPRLLGRLDLGTLPAHSRDEGRHSVAQASWVRSTVDEYMRGTAAMQEAASLRDFADKPLIVLTAGQHPASWMASQKKMVTLSTNSAQQIVAGATHTDLVLTEKYAAPTAEAILRVVESVRRHRPLSG